MNKPDIEYLISRIDSVIEHIKAGNGYMAIAKLLADRSALQAYLDNPDLPLEFVSDALKATKEIEAMNNTVIIKHHMLCIGVMAECYSSVNAELKKAIEQGIKEAVDGNLYGLPNDAVSRLKENKPIITDSVQ